MKLESTNKDETLNDSNENISENNTTEQSTAELIDHALAEFTLSLTNGRLSNAPATNANTSSNGFGSNTYSSLIPESGSADDIDPNSDLGTSIQNKYQELEEILKSLKSRLNSVVLQENIDLTDDINSPDAQFERDLDTDCTEDISLQEFLELIKNQSTD